MLRTVSAQPVFERLLDAWEALSAAEAEKAAEEAKQFKTKLKETSIRTEEVKFPLPSLSSLHTLQ